MRRLRCTIAATGLAAAAIGPAVARAQQPAASEPAARKPATWEPARDARFWGLSAVLVAATLPFDQSLRHAALGHRSHLADAIASDVDPLGRAHDVLPALAVAVVAPRLAGRRALSDAALRIGLSYLAADAVESVLKPAVGRHRPSDGRGSLRFQPFSNLDEWHAFPSAHVAHVFAIAAGLAGETRRPWIAGVAYGVAGVVGAQRVYRNAHWSSDVVGTAALAVATASTTDAWLRRSGLTRALPPARLGWTPGGVTLTWPF